MSETQRMEQVLESFINGQKTQSRKQWREMHTEYGTSVIELYDFVKEISSSDMARRILAIV